MPWSGTIPNLAVTMHAVTSTELDVLHDILVALTDPWPSFGPTWIGGSPAIGNGTLNGAYVQVGKFIVFRINLIAGSTTTFGSGGYTFGNLPVNSNEATGSGIGFATVNDSSVTSDRQGGWTAWQNGAASVGIGDLTARRVGATVPMTFASGDQITVKGIYESA